MVVRKLASFTGLALAATLVCLSAPATAHIVFFTDVEVGGAGEIRTWSDAIPEVTTVIGADDAGNSPIGVAADDNSIYWINWGSDSLGNIFRADHDGQNQSVVYSNLFQYGNEWGGHLSQHIIVDPGTNQLFWTAYGAGVFRGSTDGSTTPTLVGGEALDDTTSVAYNPTTNQLYYSDPIPGGSIYQLDASGSNQGLGTEIWTNTQSNGLAVDVDRNRLYFTDSTGEYSSGPNTIWYLDLANLAAGATMLIQDEDLLRNIIGLAMLPGGEYLYYTDRTASAIGRINLDGDPVAEQLATSTFTASGPFGLAVLYQEILAAIAGDFNNDGVVDADDLDLVLGYWGQSEVPSSWVNWIPEGIVAADELDAVLGNWGNTAALMGQLDSIMAATGLSEAQVMSMVPEPTTVVLLSLGGLLALRRRRGPVC